jgi:DNA-binding transcriptional LysR family regulator
LPRSAQWEEIDIPALHAPPLSRRYELGISQHGGGVVFWAAGAAMELHQIRYFLALCEELNFTRAAERCAVAQSSLTRAIKALEQELGGPLFHRERANTHLSELGEKVKPFLEQAFSHVQGAQRQAQDFIRARTTSLRLGLMRSIAPARLAGLVAAMRLHHPEIALQVAEASAQDLQERLLAGELDAAIYALPGLAADARLDHLPLYREPLMVVVRAAHRLARRDIVRAEDLRGEPYLCRAHCEGEMTEAFADLVAHGPAFQSDRDDWILAMAAAGLGFGLVPAHSAVHPGVAALRTEPELAREIALVTLRGRQDSPGLGALVREVARVAPIESPFALRSRALAALPAR